MLLLLTSLSAWACVPPPVALAPPISTDAPEAPCLTGDIDIGGRAFVTLPDQGLSRGLALGRFRSELGLRGQDLGLRTSVLVTRTGGEDAVGVQGEAWVPVLQIAEARYDLRSWGLSVAAGAVDDVALMPIQATWARIDMARPMLTDRGWTVRSDLGAWLSWTSPGSWVTATLSSTAGEGIATRDPNEHLTTTGVVHLRPLGDERLHAMVWGREGRRGADLADDHRLGGAAWVRAEVVVVGVDAVVGQGLGGVSSLRPGGVSLWARTTPDLPAIGWARVDWTTDDRGRPPTGMVSTFVGGGPRLPLTATGPGYLALAWEGRRASALAPAPGAGDALTVDTFFVQLGGRIVGSLDLAP